MTSTPFEHSLDCNSRDVLMNEYGSQTNDTYAQCVYHNRTVISSRVYFIILVVNGTFVILTTALFAFFAMSGPAKPYYCINSIPLSPDRKKLMMRRNKNVLQQRSIFGTTLGAFGHLVISTSILASQSFHNKASCESYIWGVSIGFYTWFFAFIWRAYRLHFLIRLNVLKARYNSFARNPDESITVVLEPADDADHRWFLKNKNCKRIQFSRPFRIYIVSLVALLGVCCILEIFLFHLPGLGIACKDTWGLYLMSAFTLLFIAVCAPITFWRLHRFKDSYGIRNEILIDIAVGASCFIMAFVWNALYGTNIQSQKAIFYKTYFPPRNWLFVFTAAAHIISVILPLLQLSHRWYRVHREQPTEIDSDRTDNPMVSDSLQQTPSTLERFLSKPEAIDAMLRLAVKDFSSENIQFYDQYMKLAAHVRQYESRGVFQRNMLTQPAPTRVSHTIGDGRSSRGSSYSNDEHRIHTASTTSLKGELEQAFINLYSTFIAEGSPLQVNVSYEARKELDQVIGRSKCDESEAWKTPWTVIPTSVTSRVAPASTHWDWSSQSRFPIVLSPDQSKLEPSSSEIPLNLALFEKVRKEVFWNIFVSVFPKYINELKARGDQ